MGRKPALTEYEKGQIDALRSNKETLRTIAASLGSSTNVVHAYLRNPDGYGMKKSPGRKPKLGPRDVRCIINSAISGDLSAAAIANSVSPQVSKRTVQRLLQRAPHLVYTKIKPTPKLTKRHHTARLEWAKQKLKYCTDWDRTIFSDEKRFTLDGPDGCKYYWHDIRLEARTFYSRQSGGGGIMAWGGFSAKGLTSLATLNDREQQDGYEFQHDNASILASKLTSAFFKDLKLNVMEWPYLSPDLTPIENLWGDIARSVYGNGRQYHLVGELEAAVREAWSGISQERLHALLKSMSDRCLEIIELKGF